MLNFSKSITILIGSLLFLSLASADEKPNVILILADDLGVNDLSCYGRKDQPTPQLDALAKQGVRFTSAYCAQPICSPTRAALMTGKTPARLHLTTFLPGRANAASQLLLHPIIQQQLLLEEITVAESLKAAGYTTGCFGKWHLGGQGFGPKEQGFDVYFPGHAQSKPSAEEGGKGEYELTAAAEQFITEHQRQPFFLFLPHNNPHVPLAAKPELIEKHKAAFNPTYAAMIETLDDCVGRIVKRVDSLGLAERTLIIFTSDNGGLHVQETPITPATHNTPFRAGKGYCYEGGLRIPAIARWMGKIKAGETDDTPIISTDWVPTILSLAEQPPQNLDGVSLAAHLTTGAALAARPHFWHFPHYTNQGGRPAGAVRDGNWKLIEHYEDGRCELFNLANDVAEKNDLAAREPNRIAELRGKLEAWRRAVGAQENSANPEFRSDLWQPLYRDIDTSQLPLADTFSAMAEKQAEWRKLMNAAVAKRELKPSESVHAGAILLHARDAKVHGVKLQYEPPPHKDTLGYWVQPNDWADWEFQVTSAGRYEVEVLQGCGKGSGGAEVDVVVGDQAISFKVEETGHFQRFIPRTVGTITLKQAGAHTLALKPKSKPGPAVMDVRRVTLRAVP